MPIEPERGCGYRVVGKLYLVGDGFPMICDALPFPLEECDCCGYVPTFMRGFSWLKKSYIGEHDKTFCKCKVPACPICRPKANKLDYYGLMWVGERYYTPKDFISEAISLGVSKAINKIPKDLVMGETWILLAHRKCFAPNEEILTRENLVRPGIFYAFIPSRYEMLIWESEATEEKIAELESKGITPIIVPDNDKAHAVGHSVEE